MKNKQTFDKMKNKQTFVNPIKSVNFGEGDAALDFINENYEGEKRNEILKGIVWNNDIDDGNNVGIHANKDDDRKIYSIFIRFVNSDIWFVSGNEFKIVFPALLNKISIEGSNYHKNEDSKNFALMRGMYEAITELAYRSSYRIEVESLNPKNFILYISDESVSEEEKTIKQYILD